ncbi:MAG: glycosyltransferase, partial [Lachnospiraceae bacterium]|nr:glycosyltransferase [Lachnospiraceae bacterium]
MSFVSRVTGPAARAGRSVYRGARTGLNKLKNLSRQKAYRYEEPAPGIVFSQKAQYERLHQGESPSEVFSSDTIMRRAAKPPVFTVIMAVSNPRPDRLEDSVISVLSQTWAGFEFIVADCGMKSAAANVLADYDDDRIRHFRLQGTSSESDALNSAALHASGDYIVFLDYGDLLTVDALFETALSIMSTSAEILYSDEDCCDSAARKFSSPYIKPDFNKDYLFASPYITHMLVVRRELFLAMRFRSRFDGAREYDLILRAPKSGICHIPRVLYHVRRIPEKKQNPGAVRAALEDYFRVRGVRARVSQAGSGLFMKVEYLPDIFTVRKEIGVIGGKVLDRRRRIIGGMMD